MTSSYFRRSVHAVKRIISVEMKFSNVNVGFINEVIRNDGPQFRGKKQIMQ
jgi:hypothetical protein